MICGPDAPIVTHIDLLFIGGGGRAGVAWDPFNRRRPPGRAAKTAIRSSRHAVYPATTAIHFVRDEGFLQLAVKAKPHEPLIRKLYPSYPTPGTMCVWAHCVLNAAIGQPHRDFANCLSALKAVSGLLWSALQRWCALIHPLPPIGPPPPEMAGKTPLTRPPFDPTPSALGLSSHAVICDLHIIVALRGGWDLLRRGICQGGEHSHIPSVRVYNTFIAKTKPVSQRPLRHLEWLMALHKARRCQTYTRDEDVGLQNRAYAQGRTDNL
jgi:hypothetical protein